MCNNDDELFQLDFPVTHSPSLESSVKFFKIYLQKKKKIFYF